MRLARRWILWPAAIFLIAVGSLAWAPLGLRVNGRQWLLPQAREWTRPTHFSLQPKPRPIQLQRPPGMAPIAFEAFIRACVATQIHPLRIGQTIGDHPRSAGYHRQDGVLKAGRETIPYCAAVDLGALDLNRTTTRRLVRELGRQGFAAWYREGPKWKNAEHIHAVYAFLPMKPQLRRQVLFYLHEQRAKGAPIWWQKKLRRTRQFRRDLS